MSLQMFRYGLTIIGTCFMLFLVVVLIAKRMWEKFPVFTAYSVVNLAEAIVLYSVRDQYIYTCALWAFESAGVLLGLGVVYELFKNLFTSYPGLRRLATLVFYWGLVGLMLVGCAAVYFQPAVAGERFVAAFYVVEEAARIVELGLIMFLFIFSNAFGLHWRQSIFGIACGLGLFVAVELTVIMFRAHFGPSIGPYYGLARGISFNLSLIVWTVYMLRPERATLPVAVPQRGQMEQWNQAVLAFIHQ